MTASSYKRKAKQPSRRVRRAARRIFQTAAVPPGPTQQHRTNT